MFSMKKLYRLILRILAVLIFLYIGFLFIKSRVSSDHSISLPEFSLTQSEKELHGPYQVTYVIDGDTFMTTIEGKETKIRLIGIDTPESVNEVNPEKNCEEGRLASAYTKDLLTGKNVWVEYDLNKTDEYDRTLAYVYLDEGGADMIQERLLADGMANVMQIGANIKYSVRFRMLKMQAQMQKKGFWEEGFWEN